MASIINEALLSICIPTYNRAEVLDETLAILLSDPSCDQRVEVVVSDNCSDDNTQEIVAKYPKVRYFRNEKNIRDANFTRLLDRACGRYIKLSNDTLRLLPGALEKMLVAIAGTDKSKYNLLFFQNYFLHKDSTVTVTNKSELLKQASYYTTWIANFGMWREDFARIEDKDRYVETQFLQVDWLYRNVENGKKTLILVDDYFVIATLNSKGGYNLFETFINKYLAIIKVHGASGFAYEREKYRLFRNFVLSWYFILKRDSKHYQFGMGKANSIIFANYWYEPYFLPLALMGMAKKLFK